MVEVDVLCFYVFFFGGGGMLYQWFLLKECYVLYCFVVILRDLLLHQLILVVKGCVFYLL